jgi:RNA polymerase sigma factor (sigma-70 family)
LKKANPGKVWEWLRSAALSRLAGFQQLDEDKKSDAFTEDFEKFYTALKSAKTPGEIYNYVIKGTVWNAMDIVRRKEREGARHVDIDDSPYNEDGDSCPSVWEVKASIESYVRAEEGRRFKDILNEIAQNLTPMEKALWNLIVDEGLSAKEIAARAGKSVNAVYVEKHRLFQKAREVLRGLD